MKNKKKKLKWNAPKLFIPPPKEVVKRNVKAGGSLDKFRRKRTC